MSPPQRVCLDLCDPGQPCMGASVCTVLVLLLNWDLFCHKNDFVGTSNPHGDQWLALIWQPVIIDVLVWIVIRLKLRLGTGVRISVRLRLYMLNGSQSNVLTRIAAQVFVCARVRAFVVQCDLLVPASISGIILSRVTAGLHGWCWHFCTIEAINWSLTLHLSVLSHGYLCLCACPCVCVGGFFCYLSDVFIYQSILWASSKCVHNV